MRRLSMQRRSLLAAIGALLAGGLRTDTTAKTASSSMPESRFIAWPVFAKTTPGIPTLDGHTDTVPDIVGRIGANDLVVFTEGNHRSEERRVGKECRSRREPTHDKKEQY